MGEVGAAGGRAGGRDGGRRQFGATYTGANFAFHSANIWRWYSRRRRSSPGSLTLLR